MADDGPTRNLLATQRDAPAKRQTPVVRRARVTRERKRTNEVGESDERVAERTTTTRHRCVTLCCAFSLYLVRRVSPRCVLAHRTWCVATSHCAPGERGAAAPLLSTAARPPPVLPLSRRRCASLPPPAARTIATLRGRTGEEGGGEEVPPPTVTQRTLRGPVPRTCLLERDDGLV